MSRLCVCSDDLVLSVVAATNGRLVFGQIFDPAKYRECSSFAYDVHRLDSAF